MANWKLHATAQSNLWGRWLLPEDIGISECKTTDKRSAPRASGRFCSPPSPNSPHNEKLKVVQGNGRCHWRHQRVRRLWTCRCEVPPQTISLPLMLLTPSLLRSGKSSPLAKCSRTRGSMNTPGKRYREVKFWAERNTPSNPWVDEPWAKMESRWKPCCHRKRMFTNGEVLERRIQPRKECLI